MGGMYQRLTNERKEEIKRLTLEGNSLNQISKLTGLGKTTIYYNVKLLKKRQWRNISFNLSEFQIGELMGAFAGDGSFFHKSYNSELNKDTRYRIRYHLSSLTDIPYANYLSGLLRKLNLNAMTFTRPKYNSIEVVVNSKEYYELIKKYLQWEEDKTFSIRLKEESLSYSEEFLRGFARGLMDTDGFLNKSNAACACISERLINNLSDIFTHFGIKISRANVQLSGNRRRLFYVRVLRENLDRYNEIIGFSSDFKVKEIGKIFAKSGVAGI